MSWSQGMLLIGLLIGAIMDIHRREISILYIGTIGILGVINQMLHECTSVLAIVGGIGIGLLFMILSKVSNGDIGMGDGLLIGATGIYLGFWDTVLLTGYALFLSGIFSLILLTIKKDRKMTIPFVPFLCIGYLWMVIS